VATAAALLVFLAVGAAVVTTVAPAGADPQFVDSFVGVGSDTTQDVMNGHAGFANGDPYPPAVSSEETGYRGISSFNALLAGTPDNCITPKVKAPTIYRSNGSSEGRRALSRAIDGTPYGPVAQCGGSKSVAGLIDFARSSAGPASGDTGTALTYIPFARDALTFAYYANGVADPVESLTRAQLTSLFTTGPQMIGGVMVVPCGIQLGSGTYQFWNTVTTATANQENAATATCAAATSTPTGDGRVQEHDTAGLKAKGDALVGQQVIIGYSAANFIAQGNGAGSRTLAPGVELGAISNNGSGTDLGVPYTGTAPNLEPVPSFYNDSVFGRNVYNVFDTARVTGFGNDDLKSLFVGPSSALCSTEAVNVSETFGYAPVASCGSTALTGSLISGIQ
jgi:ABC-type phosphate transport system substrate-binding protein